MFVRALGSAGLRLGQELRQLLDGGDQLAEIGGVGAGDLGQCVVDGGTQGGNQLAPHPVTRRELVHRNVRSLDSFR